MKYLFINILFLGFLVSCTEEVIEKVPLDENGIQEVANGLKSSCVPGTTSYQDCSSFKPFAAMASIVHTCAPDGKSQFSSQCMIQACQPGFININNNCVQQSCTPNAVSQIDCTNEVAGASSASRTVTCSATGYTQTMGLCQVQSCLPTHYKQGNFCRPKVCTQPEEKISCTHLISNALVANITKICLDGGQNVSTSSCMLESCNPGYIKSGNSCVKKVCEPNSTENVSCSALIPNALNATRVKSCNSLGNQVSFSTCSLASCKSGYNPVGNSCVPQACVPNSSIPVGCVGEIQNAKTATKNQNCNSSGDTVTYSSCTVTECLPGYRVENNQCVLNTCSPGQVRGEVCTDEINDAAYAEKKFTCNESGSSETLTEPCKLQVCNAGFTKNGNTCVQQTCAPGQTSPVDCKDQITNATIATQSHICNSDGSGTAPAQGSVCTLQACAEGFSPDLVTNTCVAQTCTPNQVTPDIDCKNDLTNNAGVLVATKTKYCNADGTSETFSQCTVQSCDSSQNFVLENNQCVLQTSSGENPGNGGNDGGSGSTGTFQDISNVTPALQAANTQGITFCKDWLNSNGVDTSNRDNIRSHEWTGTGNNYDIPRPGHCAYKVQRIVNGVVGTETCESLGWDAMDFQGNFDDANNTYVKLVPVAWCDVLNQQTGATQRFKTSAFFDPNAGSSSGSEGGSENNNDGEPRVLGWLDFGEAEVRYATLLDPENLAGSVSNAKGLSKTVASAGRNCKQWLEEDLGLSITKTAVSREQKDAFFTMFKENNHSNVPNIPQDDFPNRLSENQCLYQAIANDRTVLCESYGYDRPYTEVRDAIKARYVGAKSFNNDNIRAVATCNTSSGSGAMEKSLIYKNNLQIKLDKAPKIRGLMLDRRTLGNAYSRAGNVGEAATAFYGRIGAQNYMAFSANAQIIVKKTMPENSQIRMTSTNSWDNTPAYWRDKTGNSIYSTGPGVCLYQKENPTRESDYCVQKTCGQSHGGFKPVLSCDWYHSQGASRNDAEYVRFKFEMGVADVNLRANAGHTLNLPAKQKDIGLDSRTGPEGVTASDWINNLNIQHTELKTYTQNSDAYRSWYYKNRILGGTETASVDDRFNTGCPYEIINVGDGQLARTRRVTSCMVHACNSLPSHSADEVVRPVLTCSEMFTESNGVPYTNRVKYIHSLHIIGNNISRPSNDQLP